MCKTNLDIRMIPKLVLALKLTIFLMHYLSVKFGLSPSNIKSG